MSETAERFMADERDIEILGSVICEATAPCPACKQLAKDAIERAAPLIAPLRARIEQLEAALEVSEAVNRAKTELLVDLKAILTDTDCSAGRAIVNAMAAIADRTGPPKSGAVQQSPPQKREG